MAENRVRTMPDIGIGVEVDIGVLIAI